MGVLKSCFATEGESVEIAVIERYDETEAINVGPTNPGFDDVMGTPFFLDANDDGIGERVRPGVEVEVKAKVKFTNYEQQFQDQIGNDPRSLLTLTLFREDLLSKALIVSGKILIRPNDRLLRLKLNNMSGATRVDFEADGRVGVFVYEVIPGETGTGIIKVKCERRQVGAL